MNRNCLKGFMYYIYKILCWKHTTSSYEYGITSVHGKDNMIVAKQCVAERVHVFGIVISIL